MRIEIYSHDIAVLIPEFSRREAFYIVDEIQEGEMVSYISEGCVPPEYRYLFVQFFDNYYTAIEGLHLVKVQEPIEEQ